MRKGLVVVAVLVMVGGIHLQVWGNSSKLPADSITAGSLAKNSAKKSVEGPIAAQLKIGSLPDSLLLISQTIRTSPRRPHRVVLSWDSGVASTVTSGDVVGYNVYRRTRLASLYVRINRDLVPDASYVDDSVRNGEIYYYQTTAVSSGGIESGPSNPIRIRIPYP